MTDLCKCSGFWSSDICVYSYGCRLPAAFDSFSLITHTNWLYRYVQLKIIHFCVSLIEFYIIIWYIDWIDSNFIRRFSCWSILWVGIIILATSPPKILNHLYFWKLIFRSSTINLQKSTSQCFCVCVDTTKRIIYLPPP